jgi:hypothetical protein
MMPPVRAYSALILATLTTFPRSLFLGDELSEVGRRATQQPVYIETWLEKDALSGIFEDALDRYGVTVNVGRGFDGWDSITGLR